MILPNHVALVDPRLLLSFLGKYTSVSPVASEKYYNLPVLKQVMKLFGTVPIGDMSAGASADEVEKVFAQVTEALAEGRHILIYPSGQIYRQGFESIKGKQSVYNIVQNLPENTKILWVKTRGLWGSIWSKAWDNGSTGFGKAYLQSIRYVFANLVFFVPKRKVHIHIEDLSWEIQRRKTDSLNDFNAYLESFYNTENGEKYEEDILYVQHYFYYNDVKNKQAPEIITWSEAELSQGNSYNLDEVEEDIKQKIKIKISEIKEIALSQVQQDSNLVLDLYFDSLDLAEIKSYIQVNIPGASNPQITELKSVADLYAMAAGMSQSEEDLKECLWSWNKDVESLLTLPKMRENETILTLLKQVFGKNKKDIFLWDNIFWSQRKKDILIKSFVVSEFIKKIPWEKIGIMIPSVWSAPIIILATYLAGKTPVMFNWTLWKEAFDHCVSFSGVDNILTSKNFYDRVKGDFLEVYNQKGTFIFLEDVLKDISLKTKLFALMKSIIIPVPQLPETAVILFTSGSESLPKAVALSHTNIIENIRGVLEIMKLRQDDRLLCFLPPFHSFGFTVNTIMPLITGIEAVYTPDPNDAKTIVEIIKHTWVTGVTATPTFLKMILTLAQKEDLKTLRYAVVGAEKCSDEVFNKFRELVPQGEILEGYGITECSPVVSINPIWEAKHGSVWKVIPNLDILILDIDTQEKLGTSQQGMIYVSGSSIFSWYLDSNLESPFDEIDGKKYYKTGDLWMLDAEGFLTITGRLKRFIKIAGEMISLPFIENILLEKYTSPEGVSIAIEALENAGEAKIVLFSLEQIAVEEVNDYLRKRGVSNLVKISEVMQIEEIPLLGTGKTDYKVLKKMISQETKQQYNYDFWNIEDTLKQKISEMSGMKKESISLESIFGKDIVLDSLDVWELKIFVKKYYNIPQNMRLEDIHSFGELLENISIKG